MSENNNNYIEIFKYYTGNEYLLNTEKFLKIILDEKYDNFLNYVNTEILLYLKSNKHFNLHINVEFLSMMDIIYSSTNLIKFAEIINKYSDNFLNIYLYNTPTIFSHIIQLVNYSLNIDINNKIIYKTNNEYRLFIKKKKLIVQQQC